MSLQRIKRGEPFIVNGNYYENDRITPKSLTGVTIKCQMRTMLGILIATMVVTILDEANGVYVIEHPIDGTINWPIGRAKYDIKYNDKIGPTFYIMVDEAVTQI